MVSVIPKPDLLTLEAEYDNFPKHTRANRETIQNWLLLQLVKQLIKLNQHLENGVTVITEPLQ